MNKHLRYIFVAIVLLVCKETIFGQADTVIAVPADTDSVVCTILRTGTINPIDTFSYAFKEKSDMSYEILIFRNGDILKIYNKSCTDFILTFYYESTRIRYAYKDYHMLFLEMESLFSALQPLNNSPVSYTQIVAFLKYMNLQTDVNTEKDYPVSGEAYPEDIHVKRFSNTGGNTVFAFTYSVHYP